MKILVTDSLELKTSELKSINRVNQLVKNQSAAKICGKSNLSLSNIGKK